MAGTGGELLKSTFCQRKGFLRCPPGGQVVVPSHIWKYLSRVLMAGGLPVGDAEYRNTLFIERSPIVGSNNRSRESIRLECIRRPRLLLSSANSRISSPAEV